MAKRKKEEGPPGLAPWMATFSDLMNLLLCFFIMLFAMSTIDDTKFEELVLSLQASIGIMDASSDTILEGNLVSSGTMALLDLTEAYDVMGINSYQTSESVVEEGQGDETNNNTTDNTIDTTTENPENENTQTDNTASSELTDEQLAEQTQEAMLNASEQMATETQEMLEEYGIADDVSMSVEAQYIELTLEGAMLFDSGSATIVDDAIPIINKIGNVLQFYSDYNIEIVGHTDSIPIVGFSVYTDNIDLSFARAKTVAEYISDNFNIGLEKIKFSGRGEYEPVASNDTEEGRALNRRVEVRIYNELSSY